MKVPMRTLTLCTAGLFSLSACATKGALKRGLEEQAKQETAAQIASLRTDLQGLRTEFGAKIEQVSQGLQFAFPVHFAFNDANVRDTDTAALERFASVVQKHYAGSKITVEGFADPAGSSRYNKALSQ